MPDPSNFDGLHKQEKRVVINNLSFDTSQGFVMGIRVYHAPLTQINMTLANENFMMLNAAAIPMPAPANPGYNLPKADPDAQSE